MASSHPLIEMSEVSADASIWKFAQGRGPAHAYLVISGGVLRDAADDLTLCADLGIL